MVGEEVSRTRHPKARSHPETRILSVWQKHSFPYVSIVIIVLFVLFVVAAKTSSVQ